MYNNAFLVVLSRRMDDTNDEFSIARLIVSWLK